MSVVKTPIIDPKVIQQLLPHRHPMVMVDALLKENGNCGEVRFTIRKENLFVANNELAASGLIEHMAQAAALFSGFKKYSNNAVAQVGFIASIKSLDIKRLPHLDNILKTEVCILHEIMHISTVKLSTFIDNELIATAEMNTVLKTDQ